MALDTANYADLLRRAQSNGILGGAIYDAVIAACALAGRVDTILTFNERQFRHFAAWGLQIVVPT